MLDSHFTVMIAGIAKAGMEEYVKRYLTELMHCSRDEDGCVVYNIHQSTRDSAEFMLYSVWVSQAAFEKHNATPEVQEFKKKLAADMFEQQSPKTFWKILD